ncbi:MAG TPA: non-heme iron oxygenase ferredoxin subunit [bacterium]|nr:non-heme iron oxygenase ferredoxin subunit [bacterium]
MSTLHEVGRTAELPPGKARLVQVGGKSIALFNVGGRFYALDNTCTHRGGPLAEGKVEGPGVICPWHGSEFELQTGKVLKPPATRPVTAYRVVVEGDRIKIEF